MKIVSIIAGLLLVAAGVNCFARPGAVFAAMAVLLGSLMLVSGVCSVVAAFSKKKGGTGVGYVLADGLLSILMGILLIVYPISSEAAILIFFGLWVLFTGILKILNSLELKRAGVKEWSWPLVAGIVSVLLGMFTILNPLIAGLTVIYMIGIVFVVQGFSVALSGVLSKKTE